MENVQTFSANNTGDLWLQVSKTLVENGEQFYFKAILNNAGTDVHLLVDIDLGGGFQSGISTTSFSADIAKGLPLRFALHHESFSDEIGKFFGMEDVVIGYPEFDHMNIIKTDNAQHVKTIFSNESTRKTFQSLTDFAIYLEHTSPEQSSDTLYLIINEGIMESDRLEALYTAFFDVLLQLNDLSH